MEEIDIKNRMTAAFDLPDAPKALVERTVFRAKAIEAGREAERLLESRGAQASEAEKASLTAQGIIGRLMMTNMPPEGADGKAMEEQLMGNERFRALASRPAEEILSDLRTGRFVSRFTEQPEPAVNRNTAAIEKSLMNPEKPPISKGGLSI